MEDPAYFHAHQWLYAAHSHLLGGEAELITCRSDGRLVALFPVGRGVRSDSAGSIRVLSTHRDPQITLSDFVIDQAHATPALIEALLGFVDGHADLPWDVLEVPGARSRSCVVRSAAGIRRRVARADTDYSSFIPCGDPTALEDLSAKHLRNVRRLARKAAKEVGDLRYEGTAGPGELLSLAEVFFDVEASGWKGGEGESTAIRTNPALVAFYREVLGGFGTKGGARVDLLRIGDEVAAGQLAVRAGAVWYLLKIGHDPQFARYGPGGILLLEFLERMARDEEIREVNLVTSPRWAERWHPQTEPVWTIRIFAGSLKGRLMSARRAAIELAKSGREYWRSRGSETDA